MTRKVLLLCSSTDGQTLRICERLAAQLEAAGAGVALERIEDAARLSPAGFDLRQVQWRPGLLDVFAGKIDYPRYGPLDRAIIRFIMALTHGPTKRGAVVEFTDWSRVAQFGQSLAGRLWSDSPDSCMANQLAA